MTLTGHIALNDLEVSYGLHENPFLAFVTLRG